MQVLKRGKAELGDQERTRPASAIKRRKGSRVANGRVSFAPDEELTTTQLYTKVRTSHHPSSGD